MQGVRGGTREEKKNAVVGHHLLEKASLPWRVILGAVGWVKKKNGRQPRYTRVYTQIHTRRSLDARNSTARATCQQSRNVHGQVVHAERKKGLARGAKWATLFFHKALKHFSLSDKKNVWSCFTHRFVNM